MSQPINQFHFRGHHRHVMILPRSQPKPPGFTLAAAKAGSDQSGIVREISPHLAKDRNALLYAQDLLAAVGNSCGLAARAIAAQLSKSIEQGLLNVYVEAVKTNLHTSTEVATPVGASSNNQPQGKASSKGKQSQSKQASGAQSNYTATDIPVDEQICRSDPISMFSGEEILPIIDFKLAGVMPLVWRRLYRSSRSNINVGLGYGWRHNFSVVLAQKTEPAPKVGPKQQDKHWLELTDEEGRIHVFEQVKLGQTSYQLASGLALVHQADDQYVLIKPDDSHWSFKRQQTPDGSQWLLDTISNLKGQYFSMSYDALQRLAFVSIAPKRGIALQYGQNEQLLTVSAYWLNEQNERQYSPKPLARYQYCEQSNLVAATCSAGMTEQYRYQFDDVLATTAATTAATAADSAADSGDLPTTKASTARLLLKRTRASGYSHHFQWQLQGVSSQCVKQWGDNDTYLYHFRYQSHPDGKLTTSTDSLGNTERFVHSLQGKLLECHDANGQITRYRYDNCGRKIAQVNPMGQQTQYQYNQQGQLSAQINPDGAVTQYQYNALGQRIVTIDPLGGKHQRRFDATGRLLSEQLVDGRQRHYQYNDQGQLSESTDEYGRKKRNFWGPNGELLAEQDGATLTRYSYDNIGRLNASIDAQGLVTQFKRNAQGRIIEQQAYSQSEPDDKTTTQYHYDEAGRLVSHHLLDNTDDSANEHDIHHGSESGQATSFTYEGLAQPSQKTFSDGSWLKYHYDKERNLTGITRSDGVSYQIEYSPSEQPIKLVGFDGREQVFEYDANDKLKSIADSGERFIRLKRDAMGRITEQSSVTTLSTVNPGGATHKSTQASVHTYNFYQYDKIGRITRAHNSERTVTQQYHKNGQVCQVQQGRWQLSYSYNKQGLRQSLQLPDGSQITYGYNEQGQLSELSYLSADKAAHTTQLVSRQYSDAGLLTQQTLGNGIDLIQRFDVYSRLSKQHWQGNVVGTEADTNSKNNGFSEVRRYQYDNKHQLVNLHELLNANAHSSRNKQQSFRYNRISQLLKARTVTTSLVTEGVEGISLNFDNDGQAPSKQREEQVSTFNWDAFGNPVNPTCAMPNSKTEQDPVIGETLRPIFSEGDDAAHGSQSSQASDDNADRLLSFAGTNYRFDGSGNQVASLRTGENQKRRFNGLNQLTQLNVNSALTHYEYDALGRRSAKITEAGRIDFIWDDNQLIGEHSKGKYTWYIYQPNTFEPIALIKQGNDVQNSQARQSSEIYYYHLDQLSTPICLTDQHGQQVWRNQSDVFGYEGDCEQAEDSSQESTFTNKIENPIRFQGQYFDVESKLHYNRFRYYCPKQQRFIHQDPIGLVGGLNHYQYAPNPVNWVDPFGLSCKENNWNSFQKKTKGHFYNSSDAALSFQKVKEVQAMEKGTRPEPSTYLPQSYIDSHLDKFSGGASYFAPKWALDAFGRDPVGRDDGQFVMTTKQVNEILLRTGGDMEMIETELGIPTGTWKGQEMVIIEIEDPKSADLRIPSGNEEGANELWLVGGQLPTGHDEGVTDSIPKGEYKEFNIEEATAGAQNESD